MELTSLQLTNVNLISPVIKSMYVNQELSIEEFKNILNAAYKADWLISTESVQTFIIDNKGN